MGRPWMLTLPLCSASSPAMMLSSVDLPQPEGPSRPTTSPSAMEKLTPSSTWRGGAVVE
jgi:hypothetical protein